MNNSQKNKVKQHKNTVPLATETPAQLWSGNHDELIVQAINYLQKQFCPNDGCSTCSTCHAIRQQQHHAIIWLQPEKNYTLELISVIFKTITFALEPGEKKFFVIQKADFLTPACSNKLLKSIEEPPPGYHFLLLTERHKQLLPTIQSRCTLHTFRSENNTGTHEKLYAFFTKTSHENPAEFLRLLDQSKINERESIELVDRLLTYWIGIHNKACTENETDKQVTSAQKITALKQALLMPPMPGSSKIFWRNISLSFML